MKFSLSEYKSSGEQLPFVEYAALAGIFNGLLGAALVAARKSPRFSINLQDLALMGFATHKVSRFIAKDLVTSPFRAPFTRFENFLGYGEVQETARGHGVQQIVGEMVSCNYCMDAWIGLGFLSGLAFAPDLTRLLMKFFSTIAIADFAHVFYENKRTQANVFTLREEKLEKKAV